MRVALVTRRFDPMGGGTERDLMITAELLRAGGREVVIYAAEVRGGPREFAVRRVGAVPLGRAAGLLTFAYAAPAQARRDGAGLVLSFARAVGADVLRSGGGAHVAYLRAARRWRSRFAAAAMRASPYHRAQMLVERAGFKSPRLRRAIAVSEVVRRSLIREFALAPEKAATLYNGVDLDRFRPCAEASARRAVRARFGVPEGAPMVAFVGNGFARKGLGFLIEAWRRVGRGAHLLVVGSDRASAAYERFAARAGLGERIRFAGPQPGVEQILAASDALAMPSLFEPFGNVVMEAMASGLAPLVSAQAGAAELVPEPLRPFIVNDPANPLEIAERMNALLEAPASLRGAARAAAERCTWSAYGENLNRILFSRG